jgi:hypothetical protein
VTVVIKTLDECRLPFTLRAFASTGGARGLTLAGSLQRLPGALCIEYRLEGDLQTAVLPAFIPIDRRRHELWRQTCFELFFGIPGELQYWEVNLGLDGCWNLYHFTGYRLGMQEDAAVEALTYRVLREENIFSLSCRLDVQKLVPDCQRVEVGIAAVVLDLSGTATHWAIDHFASRPDFHDRQSFLMVLPGVAKM